MLARARRSAAILPIAWAAICGWSTLSLGIAAAQEPLSAPEPSAETPSMSAGEAKRPTLVQDPTLADRAWDYLDALIVEDHERAAPYLTAESRYQDFTIEAFGRDMVDLKGGPAILKYWKESAQAAGTVEARFDADRHFVAGPNVYFIGVGRVTNLGSSLGLPQKHVQFSFTQISHVRMQDGKVTYHADHVDYADAFEQMKEYMEDAGLDPDAMTDERKAGDDNAKMQGANR